MLNSSNRFPELSYAKPDDPPVKKWVIQSLERLSGRDYFAPMYDHWRGEIVPNGARVMRPIFGLIGVELVVRGEWPPVLPSDVPVVIIANHPFGILDGIAALTMAEDLGRPFKVLINKDLTVVPEIRPYALAIDFDTTRAAQETNIRTKKEALRHLAEGATVVVFPAGGISTAPNPFGPVVDLPWKGFVARLVQSTRATVLPVYFEGQCSPLFQLVSHVSLTLRLSLLIREFRRSVGEPLMAHAGPPVAFEALANGKDRGALVGELFDLVYGLSDRVPPLQSGLPKYLRGED